jgi:WD40 repeat protein
MYHHLLIACAALTAAADPAARTEPVSFEKEIVPLLTAKCAACHASYVRRGRYDVRTYEKVVGGGKNGPAVVPGRSADSLLVKLINHTQRPYMPPRDEEPVTTQELALLKLWIDQGAKGPPVAAKAPAAVALRPPPVEVRPVRALAISSDQKLLAVGRGNEIRLYDPATGADLRTLTAHAAPVEALVFGPDGAALAAGGFREVVVWDARAGAVRFRLTGFADRVGALAFSPSGRLLAAGGGAPTEAGELRLFDAATGRPLVELPAAHADTVFGIAFSPDGSKLATGGADKLVKVWDAATGKLLKSFEGHTHHVLDVAWRADGVIASAGADGAVKVWDAATGEQRRSIAAHGKAATRLAFVGAANVVTCGGDGSVREWNANTGAAVRTLGAGPDYLDALAAGADGAVIAVGGPSGGVRVYGADGKLRRTLGD